MNFPDIETCKAIAGEFPESEFGWFEIKDEPEDTETRFVVNPVNDDLWPDLHIHVKDISPAPTCEELGKKLVELRGSVDFPIYYWLFTAFDSDSPAQRLADGIKESLDFISESKK